MARQRFPELQPEPTAPPIVTTGLTKGSRRPAAPIFFSWGFLLSAALVSCTATTLADAGFAGTATAGLLNGVFRATAAFPPAVFRAAATAPGCASTFGF